LEAFSGGAATALSGFGMTFLIGFGTTHEVFLRGLSMPCSVPYGRLGLQTRSARLRRCLGAAR
jgi:hypothetical protein